MVSTGPQKVHFCMTGSGMVFAWINLLKLPANGMSLESRVRSISIPAENTPEMLSYLQRSLLDGLSGTTATEGELQKLSMKLAETTSMGMMAYIAQAFDGPNDVSAAVDAVESKLQVEFLADIVPLLELLTTDERVSLRQFALQNATEDPKTFFESLQKFSYAWSFFQGYIKQYDNASPARYGFVQSAFSRGVQLWIEEDGTL
eukprot:3709610-Amphidinium_carterae.1